MTRTRGAINKAVAEEAGEDGAVVAPATSAVDTAVVAPPGPASENKEEEAIVIKEETIVKEEEPEPMKTDTEVLKEEVDVPPPPPPPPSSAPAPTPASAQIEEEASPAVVEAATTAAAVKDDKTTTTTKPAAEAAAMISIEVGGPSYATSVSVATKTATTSTIIHQDGTTTKKDREPIKVIPAIPIPEPEPDPHVPSNRDVCVGFDDHIGTMLLHDLIRIHYYLWKKSGKDVPTEETAKVSDLATRLTQLVRKGKKYELSGLKDVPKPFFKGEGRFFEKSTEPTAEGGGDTVKEWKRLDEVEAKAYVTQFLLAQFKTMEEESEKSTEMKDCLDLLFATTKADPGEEPNSAPRPCDVLFLPMEYPWEENMAYEHQVGNKHLLFLASQHVSGESKESDKRVDAAFKLVTSKIEVNSGTDLVPKTPRYVIQRTQESQNSWHEMPRDDLAEFAVIFVFEVYLEKQIHGIGTTVTTTTSSTTTNSLATTTTIVAVAGSIAAAAAVSTKVASLVSDTAMATDTPIDTPTTHDVLFGRG
jgi:hypothetical protein